MSKSAFPIKPKMGKAGKPDNLLLSILLLFPIIYFGLLLFLLTVRQNT